MTIMQRLNMTTTVKIAPRLTADDWQLYTATMQCIYAAHALNTTLENAVNAGMTRAQVESEMRLTMAKCAQFGACDTEPRGVLSNLLDNIFRT